MQIGEEERTATYPKRKVTVPKPAEVIPDEGWPVREPAAAPIAAPAWPVAAPVERPVTVGGG
jgi:hypothetical protein